MALRRSLVLVSGQEQQLQAGDQIADPALASRTTTISIANVQTQVVGVSLAANVLKVGTVIRIHAMGLLTNTTAASSSILRVAIASASLGTPIVASWTCALGTTARTNCPFQIVAELTVLAIGAGGSAQGQIVVNCNTTTPLAVPTVLTAAVAIDTTGIRVAELNAISGASTTTWLFTSAVMEIFQP